MSGSTRRRFLEDSMFAAAAATAAVGTNGLVGAASPLAAGSGRRVSPNDKLRVAVLGVRGRGRNHIGDFRGFEDTEVAVICDPDEGVIGPAKKAVPDAEYVKDLREVFARDDIDIVSIATPNHWHSLATVWALQAGKHVYCEKPLSHTLSEGREVMAAAAKSGLVVQHGTQARSHKATIDAMNWLRSGGLGRVRIARGLCYKRRPSIGYINQEIAPPKTCDYDIWTGPAAMQPLRRKNLHYDWHWDFNTGNGDIGNQGVHQMDIARWGAGVDEMPREIMSVGGRVGYVDDANTPNTLVTAFGFGDDQPWIVFETRGLPTGECSPVDQPADAKDKCAAKIGVIFECDDGYLVSASYGKVVAFDKKGEVVKVFQGGGSHTRDFVDAVKKGDPGAVTAPPREGHLSAGLCHLGNVSYMLGGEAGIADANRAWADCAPLEGACGTMREHLKANDLDVASLKVVAGARLGFDPASEKVTGKHAGAAAPLLVREGRGDFSYAKEGVR